LGLSGIIKRGTGRKLNKLEEAAVGVVGCNPGDDVCIFPAFRDGVDQLDKTDDAFFDELFTSSYSKYVFDDLNLKYVMGELDDAPRGIKFVEFKRRKL